MWQFIAGTVLPLLGTFAVGVAGWWITHWIANPIIDLERLRKQIREEMYFAANVGGSSPADVINSQSERLRRLAARLEATSATANSLVKRYWHLRQYDPGKAIGPITGLSNALADRMGQRLVFRRDIESALRLPYSDSDELLANVRQLGKHGDRF